MRDQASGAADPHHGLEPDLAGQVTPVTRATMRRKVVPRPPVEKEIPKGALELGRHGRVERRVVSGEVLHLWGKTRAKFEKQFYIPVCHTI